jgi:hypothetical protein
MENQMSTGVGCFAKPDRLGRIFSRLLQTYTLGPFKAKLLFSRSKTGNREETGLLQALVTGMTGVSGPVDDDTCRFKRLKKITGFYLTLSDQKLILSIFARGNSCKSEIFTTNLDELTKLRRQRLN